MNIPVNKYQTEITEELLNSLPKEVQDQLLDFVNNVEFIKRLIASNRQYAKDRPRDERNKIIVDLVNPHILEDMDYFRPTAINFQKYNKFTNLRPNSNPNSEFGIWFKEEVRRCWEGYIRESDGEWVPGYMYWYMNYCQIMLSKIREGTKKADRVEDFPETWEGIYWRFHYLEQARNGGIYNNFHGGNHAAELARRGCSKSFSLASIMAHNFVIGENSNANKRTTTVLAAYMKEYLGGKDGTITKFTPMIDFVAQNTQFPRKRLSNAPKEMLWQMGYRDLDTGTDKGTLNVVMGVSVKDEESKLRGKRGYILLEEMGSFPNLLALYNTLRPGVEEGDIVFGLIYMVGTSGDDASDFAGAQEILYNPKGYNIYALPNVVDKPQQGRPNFAFFFPSYVNRKECYNKDGVSDVIKALVQILMKRYETKYNSTDPNTILRTIAEMPITPAEAIIKTGVNLFPVIELTERLNQIDNNPHELDDIFVADLTIDKQGNITPKPSINPSIRDFPHKDNKLEGAIEILKLPEKNKEGKVFNNRYISGIDTFDDDQSETLSLGNIWILDLWTDNIVAEYTGRGMFADDFYEICRKLLLMYSAQGNYENNKKGLFGYFQRMNCLYLLTDVLDFLKDRDMAKGYSIGNKTKGTNATPAVNNYARQLTRTWLLQAVPVINIVEEEEIETTIHKLNFIKSRAFLKELILYNSEGNFDRISGFGMLMLLREDKMILYQGDLKRNRNVTEKDYIGNDPFFTNNYDKKYSKLLKNNNTY